LTSEKNEHSTSKVINVRDSYYATPSVSCIHGSHAVDVAARRGEAFPDTHLTACDTAAAVRLLQPGVRC